MTSSTIDFPAFAVALGEEGSDPVVWHDGAEHRVDQYASSGHHDLLDEDLAAVADLGVTVWRYGMPWRLTEPSAGVYDWSWWDRALDACDRHGLIPVVDLLHFGLPDHLGRRFADPRWVEPFLAYVDAFLARYPEPRWFTPVNEPGVTATFSAGIGIWNDRVADPDAHAAALGNLVHANLGAMARIRADRDGWWIGSEGFGCPVADADDPDGVAAATAARDREWAVWDLHLGVEPTTAAADLVDRIDPAVRDTIAGLVGVVPADRIICGHDPYPVSVTAHGSRADRPLERRDRVDAYLATARAWSDRYQAPFWVSETSNLGLPVDQQTAWLEAMVSGLDTLAGEGREVRGICWYSRGDQYDWDLALTHPVGEITTVGLFDAERRPRPVAAAYRDLALGSDSDRGSVARASTCGGAMTWPSDIAYLQGLDVMSKVVEQVPADAWTRPSPCAGWRALDVLGHVGAATEMGVRILRGQDLTFERRDPPGDTVEGDPQMWWAGLAASARQAVERIEAVELDRMVDSPMGQRTVADGLRFPAADLFLHAWDIARATGVTVSIPDDAVPFVRELGDQVPPEAMRSPGVFGPEVVVPDDASAVDRLLAWTGRDPAWRPSSS